MKRAASLSVRAFLVVTLFGFSLGASALPLSPKWMKSNVTPKVTQPPSGDLDIGSGVAAIDTNRMPLPGSIWLILVGVAGLAVQRRSKSSS